MEIRLLWKKPRATKSDHKTLKLAHLADVHLGFRQYYRQTPAGINQREADVANIFRRVVDDVVSAEPDIVVFAGDFFHSVRPTNQAILHGFRQLASLRTRLPKSQVVIVAGNHDTPRSTDTGSILKLFEAVGGIHVVSDSIRELEFDELDLALTCVPFAAHLTGGSPIPKPERQAAKVQVLVTHVEIAGVLSPERSAAEYGGIVMEPGELHCESWDYVALGHYHVAHQVRNNAWYSGALEHLTSNPWGELKDEAREGRPGQKGWLLVTLGEKLEVEFRPASPERQLLDLEPIHGAGMDAPKIDKLISERIANISHGMEAQIVRQVVWDVPRSIARNLDHAKIRDFKSIALHYNLDLRRPETTRSVGIGTPGSRKTLDEVVADYLSRRPDASKAHLKRLVALGAKYMKSVEQDLLEE